MRAASYAHLLSVSAAKAQVLEKYGGSHEGDHSKENAEWLQSKGRATFYRDSRCNNSAVPALDVACMTTSSSNNHRLPFQRNDMPNTSAKQIDLTKRRTDDQINVCVLEVFYHHLGLHHGVFV